MDPPGHDLTYRLLLGFEEEALPGAVVKLHDVREGAAGLAKLARRDAAEAGPREQLASELVVEHHQVGSVPGHLDDELAGQAGGLVVGDAEIGAVASVVGG